MEHLEYTYKDSNDSRISIALDKRGHGLYVFRVIEDTITTTNKISANSMREALDHLKKLFPNLELI